MYKSAVKMKIILHVLAFTFFTITLVACQKFLEIKAEIRGDDLVFIFLPPPHKATLTVNDIQLYRDDCQEKCLMWHVINKEGDDGYLTHAKLSDDHVVYGHEFPELDTRVQPKALSPGKYTVTGNGSIKNKAASSLYYQFSMVLDVNGKLMLL
jgi:hypothetical protein